MKLTIDPEGIGFVRLTLSNGIAGIDLRANGSLVATIYDDGYIYRHTIDSEDLKELGFHIKKKTGEVMTYLEWRDLD